MSRSVRWGNPVYWATDPEGVPYGSVDPTTVRGSQNGWTPNLSQTRKERKNARNAYRRYEENGEDPNNGSVCLQTTLGAMCFATVAAAIMWLHANQASIMKGGRKTRKQYKKRSRRN